MVKLSGRTRLETNALTKRNVFTFILWQRCSLIRRLSFGLSRNLSPQGKRERSHDEPKEGLRRRLMKVDRNLVIVRPWKLLFIMRLLSLSKTESAHAAMMKLAYATIKKITKRRTSETPRVRELWMNIIIPERRSPSERPMEKRLKLSKIQWNKKKPISCGECTCMMGSAPEYLTFKAAWSRDKLKLANSKELANSCFHTSNTRQITTHTNLQNRRRTLLVSCFYFMFIAGELTEESVGKI